MSLLLLWNSEKKAVVVAAAAVCGETLRGSRTTRTAVVAVICAGARWVMTNKVEGADGSRVKKKQTRTFLLPCRVFLPSVLDDTAVDTRFDSLCLVRGSI